MRKILSIVLVLVMLLSMCIPSFAVGTLNVGNQSSDVTITVDGTSNAGTYTVTIPADPTIPWGQTETTLSYSISSQLPTGKHIKVSVTGNGSLKNQAKTETLNYSLKAGTTEYTTTESVILQGSEEVSSVVVLIPAGNWARATIDKYTGTLTFSSEII